jgi:polar amino acid transport system substrate-binding protein
MRRIAALLLLALASAGAQAACAREFSVGLAEPGSGAVQQDGLVPELFAELARRSGCHFKLMPLPRAREMLDFKQSRLDIITSVAQTPERDRSGRFVPYTYGDLDVVVIGGGVRSLEELSQRPELKLDTVRDLRLGRLQNTVDAMLATRQAEYSPNFENLFAKLAAGRLQAAVLPSVIYARMHLDGQLPANAVRLNLPDGPPDVVGLYLSRANIAAGDAKLLRHHLDALRREGWVRASYVRYIGEAETKRLFRAEAR